MEVKPLCRVLDEMGEAVIQTVGVSMQPLLFARESTVLVRKKHGLCKKNDVVLYLRPDGHYVLHRLVQAGPRWLVQGDYLPGREEINESWILGVMEGYHTHPDSPFCSVHSAKYKMYLMVLPLRRLWLRQRNRVTRYCQNRKDKKYEV